MVAQRHLLWLSPFLLRGDHDGGAVHVAAAYHQHLVSLEPVVTGKYVGRQVAARHVAQMQRSIGVWPRNGDEDVLHGGAILPL